MKSTARISLLVTTLAVSHAFQPISTRQPLVHSSPMKPQPTATHPTDREPVYPSHRTSTSLNLAPNLSALTSPLASISVLAFVILIHEAGHFLAARSLGIDVDEFSVGVGPRLLGVKKLQEENGVRWKWIEELNAEEEEDAPKDKEGIEFSLRALPFGGYVRFPPSYNQTLAFENEDAARKARDEARLLRVENSNRFEKMGEFLAAKSFMFNALTLGLLKKWATKREEEQLQMAEEEVRLQKNNQRAKSNSWFGSLPWNSNVTPESVLESDAESKLALLKAGKPPEIDYYTNPNLLQNRPWQERAIVLSGGVVFNILLAFACYFGEVTSKGLPRPVFESGAVVAGAVSAESPAFGLLKQGDIILGVNGMMTYSPNSNMGIFSSQEEISNVIQTIRKTPEGEPVRLTIVHGKDPDQFKNKEVVSVNPKRSNEGIASIGVMLGPNYLKTELIKANSPIDAISKAASALYIITSQTASSIFGVFVDLLIGKGVPAGISMSGPIGVVKAGADVVSSSDFAAVVAFAAGISVNLAVINSLPLPALDGGQLVFVLAEAISARKIDQRLQEGINAGALLILLFVSFGTAVGDVTSLFSR